jgi:hypothetical protein
MFGATSNTTSPLPAPEDPRTTVSHGSLLVAVHAQPLAVVTLTVPVPPAALND